MSELIIVPSAGVRRWLEQRLASAIGVSANSRFVFPGTFARELRMQAFGNAVDRWDIGSLTGQIFALLSEPESVEALGVPSSRGSLMVRARYIADLFDRYGMHRTDMVTQWAQGTDVDGLGAALAPMNQWQPRLWRALCAALGAAPAERTREWLADFPEVTGHPPVVHAFGLSSLSADFLTLLQALSGQRQVVLHTVANSLVDARAQLAVGAAAGSPESSSRITAAPNRNELLLAWNGVQHHGFAHLGATRPDTVTVLDPIDGVDPAPATTLLGAMQRQIAHDLVFTEGAQLDDSITFHACSGEARQLEVLRDVLLGLLNEHADLDESDILIVCPSLDRFAHLIEPIFGPPAGHDVPIDSAAPLPALRYVVNHQAFAGAAPLFEGVLELLSLIEGRVPHSRLVSFLSLPVVRRRYDMVGDDRLGLAISWLSRAQLRWGLTAEQRADHSPLPDYFRLHTLQAARESILGGIVVPAEHPLPVAGLATGVDLSDVDLAGQLGAFGDALMHAHRALVEAPVASMSIWADRIQSVSAELFETDPTATWQWTHLQEVLTGLIDTIPGAARLNVSDVAEAIGNATAHRSGRRSFGTGAITFDGPQALRSVPHRVVCLLGFDSDAVPTAGHTADDLIAGAPVPGDRDRRADARQQLLDALLAAESHVVITWDGHNIYTNATIPPATALQELIDATMIVAGVNEEPELVFRHPRFAHDARHFTDSPKTVASFDELAREVALRRANQRPRRRDFPTARVSAPLMRVAVGELLESLITPTRVLARETLGVTFPPEHEAPADLLPVELSGLERWQLAGSLLSARLRQVELDEWVHHEQQLGTLPVGRIGTDAAAELDEQVAGISTALARAFNVDGPELLEFVTPESVPIHVSVPQPNGGVVDIVGSVPATSQGWVYFTPSRHKKRFAVEAWFHAILLACNQADTSTTSFDTLPPASLVVSREGKPFRCLVDTTDTAALTSALQYLVDLRSRALSEVVPLFAETSLTLATEGRGKASKQWFDDNFFASGDRTKSHVEFFFGDMTFQELLADPLDLIGESDRLWHHIQRTTAIFGDKR